MVQEIALSQSPRYVLREVRQVYFLIKYRDWFEKSVQPLGFEEFLTCIDNMDSSNESKLIIIQESSDAAVKDRPMDLGPENRGPEVRDPRVETRELGIQDKELKGRDLRLGAQARVETREWA